MALDAFDRAILNIVQKENRLSNHEIAERVCLSEPSVRRRLAKLRKDGVITRDVSVLSREALGITFIIAVRFKDESPGAADRFRATMRESACVSQCYSVAGDIDFIVIAHNPSLADHERWAEDAIMSDPAVLRYDTTIVWSTVKYETAIAL